MKRLSVYIHIPFCMAKCSYCDFLSFSAQENDFDRYVSVLCEEIVNSAEKLADYKVATIFFGGGTPTVLSASHLNKILETTKNNYLIDESAEISIEANPETVNYEKLSALRKGGFNRISFGVQAWQDRLLKKIGRIHDSRKAEQAFLDARQAGFENINIDLMFALPEQSIADWEESLNKTISLNPEHISCYSLILEEGSRLFEDKAFILPDDETDREMYYRAKDAIKRAGYKHYEISNFSKTGMESRHNTVYWTGGDYIGLGLGAHSFIDGSRFHNTTDLQKYLLMKFESEDNEVLSTNDKYAEFMILGLRLLDGIDEGEFLKRFGKELYEIYGKQIEESITQGLLMKSDGRIFLTEKGIDLSNRVFVKFLC